MAALRSAAASSGSRSVHAVPPRLDGLLHPRFRGFVSPRNRSWGSRRFRVFGLRANRSPRPRTLSRRALPSGGFPSPAAAPHHWGLCLLDVLLSERPQGVAPQANPLRTAKPAPAPPLGFVPLQGIPLASQPSLGEGRRTGQPESPTLGPLTQRRRSPESARPRRVCPIARVGSADLPGVLDVKDRSEERLLGASEIGRAHV